ncbi:MAG TPA: prepilin-type N-terminal cleavage/methylation domain-containing protein, partial [Gammaproteobacteria bacterium]|nr:prepilin-type N-terminal cleavage/methylation domain-containing protein [Gammaproteobacteria bacterium]
MTRRSRHPHLGRHYRQQGFTLVEIMVAVAISLFLLAGILQVMSSNKQTSNYQEAIARIQENARFALMFLGRDFRQAGFMGCAGNAFTNQLNLDTTDKDNFYNLQNSVAGWEASTTSNNSNSTSPGDSFDTTNNTGSSSDWSDHVNPTGQPLAPVSLAARAIEGTDVVIVKYAQELPGAAIADGSTLPTVADINVTGTSGVPIDTIVLVTDCINADLFRNANDETMTALSRNPITSQDPDNLSIGTIDWSHKYTGSMKTFQLISNVYFIAQGAYGGPSLWQADFNTGPINNEKELVEGIEN